MRTRIWRPVLLATLLLIPVSAFSAPPVVTAVPKGDATTWSEVQAAPGRLLRLQAEPASKWLLIDDEAADLHPADAGKFADFAAPAPGRYKVIVTAPDGTSARVVVVVGDAPPGPGPKPPADPLKEKIAKAFADDGTDAVKKREAAKNLAELYRLFAREKVPDPNTTSPAALISLCRAAAVNLIGTDALLGVRQAVGGELALILPAEAPLTDDQRRKLAELFTRLAEILDTLAG